MQAINDAVAAHLCGRSLLVFHRRHTRELVLPLVIGGARREVAHLALLVFSCLLALALHLGDTGDCSGGHAKPYAA
jgi:hypothetical protein